jgi:hypothetical protein
LESFGKNRTSPSQVRQSTCLRLKVLRDEVLDRWEGYYKHQNVPKPKNKHWTRTQCTDWMMGHPMKDLPDVAFIRREEGLYYCSLLEAKEEKARETANKIGHAKWNCNEPWLRLYLSICHDSARQALLRKDDVLNRAALDARNSEQRPKTVWEVAAGVYNDPKVVFTTASLPMLHHSFSESLELRFEDMPGGEITPEEVKQRFADARAKVIDVSIKPEPASSF